MKRLSAIAVVTLVMLLGFSFLTRATAEERATKDKCIAKGEEAANLIKELGNKAALEKINDTMRPFNYSGISTRRKFDITGSFEALITRTCWSHHMF